MGKANDPRIIEVDSQVIEVRPIDLLLVVRNVDKRIGENRNNPKIMVYIANMSLSRADSGDFALTIYELDQEPAEDVLRMLEAEPDIREARTPVRDNI